MERDKRDEYLNTLAHAAHDDPAELPVLWDELKRLARSWANKHSPDWLTRYGLEKDDVVQLYAEALCRAVRAYTPDIDTGFIPVWFVYCHAAINAATGRTEKRKNDPINTAVSLDEPLTDNSDDGTLADLIEDRLIDIEDEALTAVWQEQLAADISAALADLPDDEATVIRVMEMERGNKDDAAIAAGIPIGSVQNVRAKALCHLRRNRMIRSYAAVNLFRTPHREHAIEDLYLFCEEMERRYDII